jgi:hypothetical protein
MPEKQSVVVPVVPAVEVPNPEQFSNLTNLELQRQLDAYSVEEKMLELELKREAVGKIRAARQVKLDQAKENFRLTQAQMRERKRIKDNCTHKKGGRGMGAVMGGKGTDENYAFIKHVLPSGRLFILCQRCGGEWVSRDPFTGEAGSPDFDAMNQKPTDNSSSTSTLFFPGARY